MRRFFSPAGSTTRSHFEPATVIYSNAMKKKGMCPGFVPGDGRVSRHRKDLEAQIGTGIAVWSRMTLRKAQPHGRQGFTLIELLIVVAIIGIIAAIVIPNLMDSLQKAKQASTVANMRTIGTAWMSWVTDQISAGAAGAATQELTWETDLSAAVTAAQLASVLEGDGGGQFYLPKLPTQDGWGNPFEFRANYTPGDTRSYVELLRSHRTVGIASFGRDGKADGATYTSGTFVRTYYDGDIVWSDGYLVRAPGAGCASDDAGSSCGEKKAKKDKKDKKDKKK